jgi:hypothetical protein
MGPLPMQLVVVMTVMKAVRRTDGRAGASGELED